MRMKVRFSYIFFVGERSISPCQRGREGVPRVCGHNRFRDFSGVLPSCCTRSIQGIAFISFLRQVEVGFPRRFGGLLLIGSVEQVVKQILRIIATLRSVLCWGTKSLSFLVIFSSLAGTSVVLGVGVILLGCVILLGVFFLASH